MTAMLLKIWNTVDDRLGIVKTLKPIMDHRVPKESKWAYVFGSATLFAFLLQVVTGVALATVYVPSASGAYQSLEYISRASTLGSLVRGLHYFGASAMVLFIGIHMLRVFLYAAYKFPREGNWLTGRCAAHVYPRDGIHRAAAALGSDGSLVSEHCREAGGPRAIYWQVSAAVRVLR